MIARRPAIVVLIAVLLAAAALIGIARLRIDTSLASLFDENDPGARALVRVLEHFSAVDELLIFADSPTNQPANARQLTAFAARLEKAIATDPLASKLSEGVAYRVDPQMRDFIEHVIAPNALFYLDDKAFDAARQRLSKQGIVDQLHRDQTILSTPGPAAAALSKVILKDPLRLHEFLLDRLASSLPKTGASSDGAFLSTDGRALLIRVRGRRSVSDLEFTKQFTKAIRSIAERENAEHLTLDFSGAYAIATRSEQAIRHDMIASVISSVLFLQTLFLFAYRRPIRTFFLAFLPVALGVLYGFGVYSLFSRSLTPMTAVIGGILAGMAIDYAIAVLSFYHARRRTTQNATDAVSISLRTIRMAIIAAWATSVAGFVVIGTSHVKALRDFAALGGLGLTGAFLCAITILPALLILLDRVGSANAPTSRLDATCLVPTIARRRTVFIGICVAIAAIAIGILCLPGPILPLESDLSVMHPRPNAPLDAQEKIAARMGVSPGSMVLHLQAENSQKLVELAHEVELRLSREQVRHAGVTGTFGVATLLPDLANADARIAATGPAFADRVVTDFRSALADSVFDPAAYRDYENFLHQLLTATKPPTIDDLLRYPRLGELILPTSATRDHQPPTEAITLLFLNNTAERRDQRDAIIDAVRSAVADLPGVSLSGISVLNHDTELLVRRELPRLVWIALAIVTAYLILHFRDLADSTLAILPTLFSFACLLAFMRISGQKLNMINLIAFPLLIGIDVDYGIFLVSAARRREIRSLSREELATRIAPAAAAVLLCAAATFLGFGSLAFTSVPAAQSLGFAVAVGVASCAASALLLVVPLCFVLHARMHHNGVQT